MNCKNLNFKLYRDEVVINKGEESTFMIILFSGEVGIYLHSMQRLQKIGIKENCIATKKDPGVLGDRGLLNKEPRTATCIAHTKIQALLMTRHNYVNIVESFHKTQLKMNLDFSMNLEIMKGIDTERLINLTRLYNNSVFSKGN